MKAFVNRSTLAVLSVSSEVVNFGGPYEQLQLSGQAIWVDVPAGELIEDCDLVAGPPIAFVLNAARKALRLSSVTKAQQLKQDIRDVDMDTLFATMTNQQRKFLKDARRALILTLKSVDSED